VWNRHGKAIKVVEAKLAHVGEQKMDNSEAEWRLEKLFK
jgi:hypothetical protein